MILSLKTNRISVHLLSTRICRHHYNDISRLCSPLGSLNLDRIIGVRMDGGYAIEFTSVSGQAIEDTLYLEVLVEDDDEMKIVKNLCHILMRFLPRLQIIF